MLRRRSSVEDLTDQVTAKFNKKKEEPQPSVATQQQLVSTGSTLLDLAISGLRYEQGGLPGGIMVEIFGPSGCGKTVLLCEIAGGVQRRGGEVMFKDPEGRLNTQFAQLFGLKVDALDYSMPDTVTQMFEPIAKWKPKSGGHISGIFTDSVAALSTQMEMDDADKYGMRRAKEFSEGFRKVCRIFPQRDILMVISNQVRQNANAGPFEEKYIAPGGEAIKFYASVRLRCHSPIRLTRARTIGTKEQKRAHGVQTQIDVAKNSVSEPYKSATLFIDFTYGIDDIRGNLEYLKTTLGLSHYNALGDDIRVGATIESAIRRIEDDGRIGDLKKRVIEVWNETERKFRVERKPKVRD